MFKRFRLITGHKSPGLLSFWLPEKTCCETRSLYPPSEKILKRLFELIILHSVFKFSELFEGAYVFLTPVFGGLN